MTSLKGSKIRLRAYRREDINQAVEFINHEELQGVWHPNIPFPFRLEDELKRYGSIDAESIQEYRFAIESLSDNIFVGDCGVKDVDWKNSTCAIGLFIGKPHWNKGYGTDTIRVLVRFIFNEMNLNKIKLFVFDFNLSAIHCYEKVGFKQEGVLREELFRNGKYHDVIAMGLLRDEWQAVPGK